MSDPGSELIGRLRARWVVVSFSDEGYLTREQIEQVLAARGEVAVLSRGYPRYVGAKIGIHAPDGAKVGTVSHLTNTEHLYLCGPGAGDAARAAVAAVG